MDQGSSKQPSEPLQKLFQEAWNELRAEKGEDDPITTTQIVTRDGEKKNVNGLEFWQQMMEDVEKQKDDPEYLYYSPIDEENIEELFTTTDETQPEEEPAIFMNGKYYIPRISNLYLQNLNLGFDQWYIVQDIPPNPKAIKIVRRKLYVSPSSTDDEIMLELIYAMEMSEKEEKERLEKKKKESEEKKENLNDSDNTNENIELEKLEMQEFEKPGTSKARETDDSDITELDAFLEPDKQLDFADMDNMQRIMLEQIMAIQKIERDRDRANELEKQIQTLEKGKTEDVMEMENTKETEQISHKGKFEASCSIDLCSFMEGEDEVLQQKEFETSSFLDLTSCLEHVGEIPKQTEQLSNDLASSTKEKDKVSKKTEQMSRKRKFEACYSKNLASCSGKESQISPKNTTHVQVTPNPYQDTVMRDLRPNVAAQNVNPQNLGININYSNVVPYPQKPVMIRPNYERVPFFNQQGNIRKSVNPYKFCNPYYGHGLRHLVRNPFSFRFSRPQFPQPPPAHRQPRLFKQPPFTPKQTARTTDMQPQLFPKNPVTPTQTAPPVYRQPQLFLQNPVTPTKTPPSTYMQPRLFPQNPVTPRQTRPEAFIQPRLFPQNPVTLRQAPPPAYRQPRLFPQNPVTPRQTPPPAYRQPQVYTQHPFAPTQTPPQACMSPQALLQEVWRTQIAALPRISPQALMEELWRARTGTSPRLSPKALMQELWRAHIAAMPRLSQEALLKELRAHTGSFPRMSPRFPHTTPRIPTPPLAHKQVYHRVILKSGFPPAAHHTQKSSVERNQQSLPCPSIRPPSQWTSQSKPVVIHNPNTVPNYEPENFQLAHEQSRTQIAPNIPPNADRIHFVNYIPAHLSNISTTLANRKRVVQDITNESPWECIISIKKKSRQTQVIAQAPLCSVIPLPDDDIGDGRQDDVQSDKCVLIPSLTAKPKKSALRRHNVNPKQRRRRVHFSQRVIERDEMKTKIARSIQARNLLMDTVTVDNLFKQLSDDIAKLRFIETDMEEENAIELELKYNEANSHN